MTTGSGRPTEKWNAVAGPGWRVRATAAAASALICGLFVHVLSASHFSWIPQVGAAPGSLISVRLVPLGRAAPEGVAVVPARKPQTTGSQTERNRGVASNAQPPDMTSMARQDVSADTQPGEPEQPEPGTVPLPIRVDLGLAVASARPEFRRMAESAGVALQHGGLSKDERIALAITRTEKRDCLGPRKDLKADLVQLAIYLHTVASGKCKGQ